MRCTLPLILASLLVMLTGVSRAQLQPANEAQNENTSATSACDYEASQGAEFTFAEQAEKLRHYGYQMWTRTPAIPPSGLNYDDYVGKRAKFTGVTATGQIPSAKFLEAITSGCEKLYYFSPGGKGVNELQQISGLAGIRFASEDKTTEALVGKNVWIDTHTEHKVLLRDSSDAELAPLTYGQVCKVNSIDRSSDFTHLNLSCGTENGKLRFDPLYVLTADPINPAWSHKTIEAIKAGSVMLGMRAEHVRAAWGKPTKVNKTVTAAGIREQWVYGANQYVYLTNGSVSAIQASESP